MESRLLPGVGGGGRKKSSETWGRAWIDMYEAASQAGGGRVQGQARRRRQTPVLEEERGEMRNAREDGMDRRLLRRGFAIDREFGCESGSGEYARDEAAEMAWNGAAAAVWRACTYT